MPGATGMGTYDRTADTGRGTQLGREAAWMIWGSCRGTVGTGRGAGTETITGTGMRCTGFDLRCVRARPDRDAPEPLLQQPSREPAQVAVPAMARPAAPPPRQEQAIQQETGTSGSGISGTRASRSAIDMNCAGFVVFSARN